MAQVAALVADSAANERLARPKSMNRSGRRARATFHAADVRALWIGLWLRVAALGVILICITTLVGSYATTFYLPFFAGYIAIGYGQYLAGKQEQHWALYGLILADFLLMAATLVLDNPVNDAIKPPGQVASEGRGVYLFILLASVAGCYDARRVLWGGLCAAISWTGAFYYLATRPNAFTIFDTGSPVNGETFVTLTANPYFVDIEKLFETIVVVGIVTVILATVAHRARRIVRAEISATRERANLARYFAPSMAEDLANQDTPFDVITSQNAAVLFADVVGFTKAAENEPPERVIGFLRALHMRLERAIFENDGTLDKYMGDGLMATFGTPRSGPDDASRAIAAARAIIAEQDAWNVSRAKAGFDPVRIAVGVHYGPVVSGDIGSERRLEFATIGDAVNLAARLEQVTRTLDAAVVISEETADQVRSENSERAEVLLDGFVSAGEVEIRGHSAARALRIPLTKPAKA